MFEKQPLLKKQESKEQTPHPNLLDIVKIDNRWAQVVFSGDHIRYLSDNNEVEINWDDFHLTKDWGGLPVYHVKDKKSFTLEELEHIHWETTDQKKYPHLREQVSVFGEFKRKLKKIKENFV